MLFVNDDDLTQFYPDLKKILQVALNSRSPAIISTRSQEESREFTAELNYKKDYKKSPNTSEKSLGESIWMHT
ncbi:hypothetical protein C1H46_010402 [Malus baccata]|uniref:Uncharacterized protein n=1 Tax=Malus baccata TaxID=106549 RepID=A0A540MZ08_MALBA|nr:hypothetical protein C1H46_010402 [Malus baccata]